MPAREAKTNGLGRGSQQKELQQLMKAIERKNLSELQAVLRTGVKVDQLGDAFNTTALHQAVLTCWLEGVQALLSHGAKVFTQNQFGQTPLHYAAGARSVDCMRALLLHEKARSSTGHTTLAVNYRDNRGRTALHDAAEQNCVEIVRMLLQAKADVDVQDNEKESPIFKAARACAIPAMVELLKGGASMIQRDGVGDTVINYCLRHNPGGVETLFDSCLETDTNNLHAKDLEVKFNFIPCMGSTNQMRCMWCIVQAGHAKLLKHPLCETFLLVKWFKVKTFFYIRFLFYFMYAILTTLLTFDKFSFGDHNTTYAHLNENYHENCSLVSITHKHNSFAEEVRITILAIVLFQSMTIFLSLVLSIIYTFNVFRLSVWNLLHGVISCLVLFVLAINIDNMNLLLYQHHCAVILLLLLWTKCMLLVGQIPACGIYVVMFTRVAVAFVRLFAVYFSLLLAFTFAFYISEDHGNSLQRNSVSVLLTFLKTLTMMIGELDFDASVKELQCLPVTSHIIFLLFIILIAIILSNLLVALAVNDVQTLRNSAHQERLIKQMELVYEMEQNFYGVAYLLERFKLRKLAKYPKEAILFNHRTTLVTMAPYNPHTGNCLMIKHYINDSYRTRLERVSYRLASHVLECVRERPSVLDQNRKPSAKPRRLNKLRATEYCNNDDLKDSFKQLESNLCDMLCDRLSELVSSNVTLNARILQLETELRALSRSSSLNAPRRLSLARSKTINTLEEGIENGLPPSPSPNRPLLSTGSSLSCSDAIPLFSLDGSQSGGSCKSVLSGQQSV